jgi:hypothetical protein
VVTTFSIKTGRTTFSTGAEENIGILARVPLNVAFFAFQKYGKFAQQDWRKGIFRGRAAKPSC